MSLLMLKGKGKYTLIQKKKVEVIRATEESEVGVRKLVEKFNCDADIISSEEQRVDHCVLQGQCQQQQYLHEKEVGSSEISIPLYT